MTQSRMRIMYNNIRGMDGRGWGVGDGLPVISRVSLYERDEIMIGSNNNSGGVVVGALVR